MINTDRYSFITQISSSELKLSRKLGTIVTLSLIIALFLLTAACHDKNNSSNGQTRALSERDFVNDPSLSANPEEGVVAVFLEPTDAPEEDNLTGGLGFDVIPHRYTRTLNHTICWEDDNVDSKHFMILLNSDGEEVLRALANGGCVTERIEAGDYMMVLTHGEHVDEIEPVFLMPALEEEQIAKIYRRIPSGFSKFFESISNVFTRPAIAQTDPSDNVTTLISTNACVDCDLMDVDLTGNDLTFADLCGANLSGANLSGIELFEAGLIGANLKRG